MGKIFYIGFYWNEADRVCRKNIRENIAGTVKMDFILKCLRQFNREIVLVSIMPSKNSGFQHQETIKVSEKETHVYLPALVLRVFGKNVIRGDLSLFFLKQFMLENVTDDDIVINYHSLIFGNFFLKMRQCIRFRWICEVEELYSRLTTGTPSIKRVRFEQKSIQGAEGYILANDYLAEDISGNTPRTVVYGNYTVFLDEKDRPHFDKSQVVLVYAGGIRKEGDLFVLLDAMEYLPKKYNLMILGTGAKKDMALMNEKIKYFNTQNAECRIRYCGVLHGKEYTDFLAKCDIGCSLMEEEQGFSTAFPSKILTYLGHGLKVVSTDVASIRNSQLADLIFFCRRNGESVAQAIQSVEFTNISGCSDRLRMLESRFKCELQKMLDDSN